MYESEKLDEAEYFLQQMAKCQSDRLLHKYNLSAFLSAARSVLQFANNEAVSKPGGQTWYDSHRNNPIVIFFKERRNWSIHTEPVRPINEIQMHIEETLHFCDDMAEAMVIRYDNPGPSKVQQQPSRWFPWLPNWPHSSKVTMSGTCRFKEWKGTEDLPTLCGLYLDELRKIVADGQSKGFLTP